MSGQSLTREALFFDLIERGLWPGGSRLSTVRKLAEVLEVDPHELLAGSKSSS